jgi:hypothetical protein
MLRMAKKRPRMEKRKGRMGKCKQKITKEIATFCPLPPPLRFLRRTTYHGILSHLRVKAPRCELCVLFITIREFPRGSR